VEAKTIELGGRALRAGAERARQSIISWLLALKTWLSRISPEVKRVTSLGIEEMELRMSDPQVLSSTFGGRAFRSRRLMSPFMKSLLPLKRRFQAEASWEIAECECASVHQLGTGASTLKWPLEMLRRFSRGISSTGTW